MCEFEIVSLRRHYNVLAAPDYRSQDNDEAVSWVEAAPAHLHLVCVNFTTPFDMQQ